MAGAEPLTAQQIGKSNRTSFSFHGDNADVFKRNLRTRKDSLYLYTLSERLSRKFEVIEMRNKLLFAVVIFLSACTTNHKHDGLYLANKAVTGITKAWILEGDVLTVYSMGASEALRCKQFDDRIEISGGEVFIFNSDGDLVSSTDSVKSQNYRMVKMSERTKYNIGELDKIVNDAYENERKIRQGVKP